MDTSAFVPLIVQEPGSASCRRIWNDRDVVISSRLLYVETAAALARARRMKRLTLRSRSALRVHRADR
ncbi:MAG TPA: PIN domain-containing protein [Mycobacteriales bacterium]|nr:PIN domain-containing protein [Mycobacteriales bacterium]